MSKQKEVYSSADINEYVPVKDRNQSWYLSRFERNLVKLTSGKTTPQAWAEVKFGGITPDVYTPVVLRRFSNTRHEILISENPVNGYNFLSHLDILNQYELSYDHETTFNGFLFVSSGKQYLLINALNYYALHTGDKEACMRGLIDTLCRYNIDKAFSAEVRRDIYEAQQDFIPIDTEEFIKNFDKMAFDDWTYSMAEHHQWTIFEWLRFRMTREVPEKRVK